MKAIPFYLLFTCMGCIFPLQLANTCSWGYDIDESNLSPFNSEMLDLPELFPFYYSEHYYNGDPNTDWSSLGGTIDLTLFDGTQQNLEEWSSYFKGIPISDIQSIIYNTSVDDYSAFAIALKGKNKNVGEIWLNNGVLKFWMNNPKDPSFKYLTFAKTVEPHVQPDYSWEPVPRDTALLASLKSEALKELKKTDDPFIKLRYAYQAARCAHYSKSYQECIDIYNKYVATENSNSQIKYWSMSLMAGAYWRLNQFAEAGYYNALVFDNCLSRRLGAERDFYMDSEATWQKCLSMCKNDHEKNVLWFLTGVNQNNSTVPALNEMLKIDPGSKELEVLLAREVEKIQRTTMPTRWWNGNSEDISDEYNYISMEPNDIADILEVINNAIQINKMRTPAFWYNAAAFLYFIDQKPERCKAMCELALQNAKGDAQQIQQAKITSILNKVNLASAVTPALEKQLLDDLKWLSVAEDQSEYANRFKSDAYRIVMFNLMKMYLSANNSLLAELCRARAVEYYDIYEEPEKAPIDELYNFFTVTKKSAFETFLAEQYPYGADIMLEIKGTLLMRENKLKEAITIFKKIQNNDVLTSLSADPFIIHINDCHDCDFSAYPTDLNKLTLAETILQLQAKANAEPKNSAEIYNQLGNIYYNISYWGNAWNALDYYRCHGCETNSVDPDDSFYYYYNDQYDLTQAIKYYTLAAKQSSGKQFAALNYFMLAKCEQNNYFHSDDYEYENESGIKLEYQTNFSILKNQFSETDFYKEAIKECTYFEYYVNNH